MKGIIAVHGMALARAHLLTQPAATVEKRSIADAERELGRFRQGVSDCLGQLERLMDACSTTLDDKVFGILDFQLLLLEDTDFIGKMEGAIRDELVNAEYAVKTAAGTYISYLEGLTDNDYLRERAADVADLTGRLIGILSGVGTDVSEPEGAYIAIAADIAPSRIAGLDREKLKGVVLEKGGVNSHCVILSQSLGIPCLIETAGILKEVRPGETVLLDAVNGEVCVSPSPERQERYARYAAEEAERVADLRAYINRPSETADGSRLKVFANITTRAEAEALLAQGGEGVGLFRSELLFMSQTAAPPSEEQQFVEYAGAAGALAGLPLIIRTLDVGGDKQIGYLDIAAEENPFLGYRAIRYCLDHPEIFKPQVAAILRAGAAGNVSLMLPMISCKAELTRAKELIEEVKDELRARGEAFCPDTKLGMMVETPAAAFDAERLAREVDFFSIGTNDLTQYLFAADRANAKVAPLNSHFQPALLRVVNCVARAAQLAGIEVDICGAAGEVPELIPLWVAMGIDALSVSIPRITAVRREICHLKKADCAVLLDEALRLDTAEETERLLTNFFKAEGGLDDYKAAGGTQRAGLARKGRLAHCPRDPKI